MLSIRNFKKLILSVLALHIFSITQAQSNVNIGLVYPVSTNGTKAPQYVNDFSLHALLGMSRGETGATLAGFGNIILDSAAGSQIAGFYNGTRRTSSGVQVAGFMNHVGERASGVEIAGFMNYVGKEASGMQMAGFINVTGKTSGEQIAGFANIAGSTNNATQIAGFMNKGTDVDCQIAGFLNVAKKVRGVQIGFINIADSSNCSIGLINLIKKGEKQISASIDESGTVTGSFKSGGRTFYGIAGVAYNLKDDPHYGLQAGVGAHWPLANHFRINFEVSTTFLTDFESGSYNKHSTGIFPAYKIGQRFEIFAGPTFNFVNISHDKGKDFVDHYMWTRKHTDSFDAMFFGASGGVQFTL